MYGVFYYETWFEDYVTAFPTEEEAEDYIYSDACGEWWRCDPEEEGYSVRFISQEEYEAFEAEADS